MRNIPRESEELFLEMARTIPPEKYPPPIAPVKKMLSGTGFFPGRRGLWMREEKYPPFPSGGAMIVGQDWNTRAVYERDARNPRTRNNMKAPTWRNLRAVLNCGEDEKFPMEKCFFTNFFMGLREGGKSTGKFPGAKYPRFFAYCEKFFLRQIAAAKPRLLVVLGVQVPRRIAELSDDLREWRKCKTMKQLDAAGALKQNVRFGEHETAALCWILHPSMRGSNLRHRRYKNKTGDNAEKELMRDAIRISGINQ